MATSRPSLDFISKCSFLESDPIDPGLGRSQVLNQNESWVGLTVESQWCPQRMLSISFDRIRRILDNYEDEILLRCHQHLVLLALDPQVGQLVGGVQVSNDGLGSFGQLRHEHRVLKNHIVVWSPQLVDEGALIRSSGPKV